MPSPDQLTDMILLARKLLGQAAEPFVKALKTTRRFDDRLSAGDKSCSSELVKLAEMNEGTEVPWSE